MTDTGGLAVLYGWLIFAFLLAVLAFLVLRRSTGPDEEAQRQPDDPADVP
jgi:hypothetical protein